MIGAAGGTATLWAGSYAARGGCGLYPLLRAGSGLWQVGAPFEGAQNASFGVRSSRHGHQYLVDEQGGAIGVYRHDRGWKQIARFATVGTEPCYVALDPDETRLAVANYGSGTAALFALDPATGLPIGAPDLRINIGSGPNADRQEGPHAHCVVFGPARDWLHHVDLGTDQITATSLAAGGGEARCAFAAPPGSGPRHLVFHPSGAFAFLVSELASTLTLFDVDGPLLRPRQCLSTLPGSYAGESLGGHIGLNAAGDRVYVTNRGHDSVASFAFDGAQLSLRQHLPSGGRSPRFFLLCEAERWMFVAHEESGTVTGFRLRSDGTLEPTDLALAVPGAVTLFTA